MADGSASSALNDWIAEFTGVPVALTPPADEMPPLLWSLMAFRDAHRFLVAQDHFLGPGRYRIERGHICFVEENQGVWELWAPQHERDPVVLVADEDGVRSGPPLSESLWGFVLQELAFGAPFSEVNAGLLDAARREGTEPLWTGRYVDRRPTSFARWGRCLVWGDRVATHDPETVHRLRGLVTPIDSVEIQVFGWCEMDVRADGSVGVRAAGRAVDRPAGTFDVQRLLASVRAHVVPDAAPWSCPRAWPKRSGGTLSTDERGLSLGDDAWVKSLFTHALGDGAWPDVLGVAWPRPLAPPGLP